MNETIVDILVRRDGVSRRVAEEHVQSVRQMLQDGCNIGEIEDLMMDEFGLEPDYLLDLLGF